MKNWVRVRPDTKKAKQLKTIRGVQIEVQVSPYDIPEAVRGEYSKELSKFVIEFKYIGEEPFDLKGHQQHVALRIGKNSGRLYGIEIDVDALKVSEVRVRVTNAIDSLIRQPPINDRLNNYRLAGAAFAEASDRLFQPVENFAQ